MDLNPGNWGLYYVLNKYCNLYLDDVKAENVKMALWSGSATIRDFSLKTDSIGLGDFPLTIVQASVGLADIQIPWKAWRKKAPEVTLQDIRLVLKTTPTKPTAEENKEAAIERFERDVASLLTWVESVLKGTNSFSFLTKSMLSTLLHNLKVTLVNLTVVLEHSPAHHSEVHKFTLNVQVDRLSSYSTDSDFQETPTWDAIRRFRRAEIHALRANSEFSPADQPALIHKSVVLSPLSLSANVSFWQFDLVEFTTDRGDVDINIDCSYIALRLSKTLIEVLLELNQRELEGNAVLTPKERFCRAGNKVRALVRSQLARTSLISVVRKAFWKEMYIQGYMLHLNKGLVPQNQIGFSHGEKDLKTREDTKVEGKTCNKDPRYLSAAFYDLESLLSLSEILSYRREAVERHLMQVTKLEKQVLGTSQQTVAERQGPKRNVKSRFKLLIRAEEEPKRAVQGQKQVCVQVRVGISSCAVELIALNRSLERRKCREQSCFFFRTEGVVLMQTSVVTYSPLLTLHNRFAHEEVLTKLTVDSVHLWLTAPTEQYYAMRKPVAVSPSPLTVKFKSTRSEDAASSLQYLNRRDLTMHVELEEANIYIYPELLTCLEDYFAFCFSPQSSKYAKEVAFFQQCRPTPLFRSRSAINRRVKVTCKQLLRVALLTSFQNHSDAAIFELVYFKLKAEKWPSDTIAVEINSIRAFALSMPRANADLLEVVRTVPRVLFTAGFCVKLLIASYKSVSAQVRDKKERRKEVHKELKTPDYLLSVRTQELLIHLTRDQLKSLVSLAEVWTRSPSSPALSPYTPLQLDLTTKQMRRATHQVQFSLELDCKGAVISIVSGSGPYMKILAHQFEMSYKGKAFESLVLVQCQGLEVLDTRSYRPAVLFAIGEGEKGKWVQLIQQAELDQSGFLVDRKNVLILTCRSNRPESEQYRNISSEVQLAAQSLHLTYNPRILADTLSLFQPILSPQQSEAKPTAPKEAKEVGLKLVLDWGELYLNCIFEDQPLFSFHTRNVISVLDVYAYKTQFRLHSEDLHCVDTSRGPAYNKLILGTADETAYFAVNYEAKSVPKQAETATLQVRMRNSRLVYLHRVVMDILEYVNRFFVGESDPTQPVVSPMAMEILFSECEIELPRNSLASEWQSISLDQLFLRRNAGEGSQFESSSQFEYEAQPAVDWSQEPCEKQAARTRRTRLNQYQPSGRELYLSVEEVQQLRPVYLKGLSVYYYKPEGLASRVDTGEGSFGRLSPVLQSAAPDPTDSEVLPSQSKDSLGPAPSNWQIQASNLRLFGVGGEEILCSSSLRVFLFSSACPKLQIQLEDDINFFFTQRSFTFLLQTLLENMGELQTIPPAEGLSLSSSTANSPDFCYFQIVLLGNKANFLFSAEEVADENAGAHDLDLAQFIFSDLRIECSLQNSGSKAIRIELDGFTLRDQRLKSLLRYLSMGDENFEPLVVFPNTTESDISRANLVVEMQLLPSGVKEINVVLADCQVLLVPDLFTALQGFFTNAFDPTLNPPPSYIQLPAVIPSAEMRFTLSLESINFLFPSSFDSLKSTLLVLHTQQTALTYKTTGDAYNGPGSARMKCLLKITHMFFSNFEEQQMESINHAMLLLHAEVNLEYLLQKPSLRASWVGEQVLVHVVDGDRGGVEDSKWHFNLTISEVWKIMDICKCLSQPSLSRPSLGPADVILQEEPKSPDISQDSPDLEVIEALPLKLSPDIPTSTLQRIRSGEELRNFSLSLAIDKVLITVLNKDTHPLLSFQSVTLGTYQSQGDQSSQCQVEAWLTVHYFNQRTTAWEPALEWCSWDLDLSKYNQHSKLTLSSDISKTLLPTNINLSYALIDLIGGLWKNWSQEIEGTELSSATPYKFYNYTGLPLGITTSSDESGDILELEPNEVREISLKFAGHGKYLRFSSINHYRIDIIVNLRKATTLRKGFFSTSEEFRKVKNVAIDTSDVHVMPLIERWTHYDFSAYKRSATKKVRTLKLKDKIESFFVQADHEKETMEEQGNQAQSRCCSCLPWGKKAEPEVEQEQTNIRLLVVEVRWIQEFGLKEILIRSSLTLRNELSTLVEVEMSTLSNAPVVEEVYPGKKLYIPLPVVNFGSIKIRPNKDYDWSREITLSALSGIVKEKELKRLDVEGLSHGTESLVLGFVPLICKSVVKTNQTLPFSCALETLKKKNNTIRKKVVKDERYVWVPDKRMMNMRRSNSAKGATTDLREELEDPEDDLGEEELIFQERELLLSSIMSITNALPVPCIVEISDEESKVQKEAQERVEIPSEAGEERKQAPDSIPQGQTYHLFFTKFYVKSLHLRLKLDGYALSNPLKIRLGKIKEEKKFTTRLLGQNSNHKLFVKVAVGSDDFGCWRMTIYVPFWILNKTTFKLLYAEPELFQAKREAKQTSDTEEKPKESAPDFFAKAGEEDDLNEEDFKETRGLARTATRRKTRKTLNLVECPFCKCKNQVSPFAAGDKLCTNCRKPLVSDGSKSPLARSERLVACNHCGRQITLQDYPEGWKHAIECPNCKGSVSCKKQLQFSEEETVKRLPLSSPGAFAATQSRKSTSVISTSKAADWSKFIVYSPSQMVSKLKVAMMDSEIKVGKRTDSKWSDTFSLGNAGTSGTLSFNMHNNDMKIDLGVRIDRGKGVFHRTNIITFTHRYMLKSQNMLKLVCRQVGTERIFPISSEEFSQFDWPNRSMREIMTIALYNEYSSNLKWSGGFYIHEQGEFIITVQNDSRKTEDFILVSIVGVGPTQVVQFQQQKKDDSPPFLLRNFTSHQVHYVQNVPGRTDLKVRTIPECRWDGERAVPSFHYYALDEETERAELDISIANVHKQYLLDVLGEMEPMDLKSSAEGWTSSTKRKWGLLEQKRRLIGVYKRLYAEVSDGVMIRKKSEQDLSFKSISLLEECVKAVDYQNSVFYLYTCLKRYQFRASSPEDAQAWIQALMEGKEASGSVTSQLIHVDIALEGATHVLSLRTGNSKNQKGRHMPGCKILQEQLENRKKLRSKEIWFEFQFYVSSVNISIIDDGPQEVLLLSLAETQLEYYQYRNHYEGFQITINVIKLDNQTMQNYWPVILAPFARKRKDLKKSVFVSFSKHSGPQLDHIHYLDIYVQPIELRLEGSVLNFLLRAYDKVYGTFVSGETQAKTKHKEKTQKEVYMFSYTDSFEEVVEMAESPPVPPSEQLIPAAQKKLFIEELVIQPFWIVLSVNMNSPIDSPLPRKFLFSLASIGLAITSIEAAEINMEGLRMIAMYQLRSRFAERLVQHYYSKCVFQVYKILGAMEFLGNPANLLQSFKAGMKAALVKPVYALMRDPRDFIPELLKGSFGMVTHTIHGVFTSASKLAGGIGRSLALLTMDQQFQRARRNLLNRKVSSIADGLMMGLKHAGYGLFDGVTSIVTSPMQGYKQGGVEGLFAGIGKGIVGTVVKPVSGLFDAFSATTSTLGKYARAKFEIRFLERTRIPRHFHKDRILYPYDAALAQAQFLLYRYNPVYRHEYVTFFAPLGHNKDKYVLIITKSHIFYMREKSSSSEKGKKFNKETIQDIKLQDYAKSLHILFKDGKKLLIDCNSIEDKDKDREGSKWKELSEICLKFGREARVRGAEEEASDQA